MGIITALLAVELSIDWVGKGKGWSGSSEWAYGQNMLVLLANDSYTSMCCANSCSHNDEVAIVGIMANRSNLVLYFL